MADKERPKLFEYAILFHPKPRKIGNDGDTQTDPSEILVEPKRIVAKDEATVGILAAREIPEAYLDKLDSVEVIVRPF
jgi:hypothetical protein